MENGHTDFHTESGYLGSYPDEAGDNEEKKKARGELMRRR